jgi:hypothetical protein
MNTTMNPPKPVIETIPVEHRFNIEEIGELARRSALETQRANELEERKKQVASDLKAQIEACQAQINSFSAKISNGFEMRDTECEIIYDPPNSTKHYYNAKTMSFVRSAEMTRRDFELSLPFEKDAEEKGLAPDPRANPENLTPSQLAGKSA